MVQLLSSLDLHCVARFVFLSYAKTQSINYVTTP